MDKIIIYKDSKPVCTILKEDADLLHRILTHYKAKYPNNKITYSGG